MARKEIVIDIDENGNVSMDGKGFNGVECDKTMAEIEKAIGTSMTRNKKREYTMRQTNKKRESTRNR